LWTKINGNIKVNIIQNTIHKSHKKDKLNILVMPFIGQFEYDMANSLKHNLFIIDDFRKIDEFCENNNKPPNITFFPAQNNDIRISKLISFDLILINGRNHYEFAEKIMPIYQIPAIIVEHEMPSLKKWQMKDINQRILSKQPAAIISINQLVFKYWKEVGVILTKKEEWQELLFNITRGGFDYF
jgi:hypothetical protein